MVCNICNESWNIYDVIMVQRQPAVTPFRRLAVGFEVTDKQDAHTVSRRIAHYSFQDTPAVIEITYTGADWWWRGNP